MKHIPVNTIPKRLVIYPKDVELLTGRKPRTARHLLQTIRKELGKSKNAFITILEFAQYTGLKAEDIYSRLLD